MEEWRLVNLGALSPYSIHAVYEAIALAVSSKAAPNTIELCYPSEPYVCIGVHQCAEFELDLQACEQLNLKVVRRQVGGGTTYLDPGQQFYHIVVHRDHGLAKQPIEKFYEVFLRAVAKFYRSYGLPADYKPINDVVISGRKASGNGAALLHDAMVLVGNVILDFDPEPMAKVLKVPSEKFRDKVVKDMKEWVTSLKRELGYVPDRGEVIEKLITCFEEVLGIKLVQGSLTDLERQKLVELEKLFQSKDWLYSINLEHKELMESFKARKVKIREGHYIIQADYKALKMIRVLAEVVDGTLSNVMITGDFFAQPVESVKELEEYLKGCRLVQEDIEKRVNEFFKSSKAAFAGVKLEDLVAALLKVKERLEVL
ncbi:MAG: hypothetical protein DRJ31_03545 [Candidatus Methanomethylicota archaeon]|uniref:lipoate--protein ligase n=2 Tax=Thermoproteota archaeon TaxID=2056631 RepID=A0A497ERK2_9CREN|nr:MAG: hypothetical protein DRJ31_03545 [Candidatus Verstraetearchaeota archaeon]